MPWWDHGKWGGCKPSSSAYTVAPNKAQALPPAVIKPKATHDLIQEILKVLLHVENDVCKSIQVKHSQEL